MNASYARPRVRGCSPWDTIQHVSEVPGSNGNLLWISTSGHGGLWMSPEFAAHFRSIFPEFNGYAGLPWLEEDCDWAMAVLAFPQYFNLRELSAAVHTVIGMRSYHTLGCQYLEFNVIGQRLVRQANQYDPRLEPACV